MDSNVEETRDKGICRKRWGVVAWSSVCRDPEWDTPKGRAGEERKREGEGRESLKRGEEYDSQMKKAPKGQKQLLMV
jgi:hypothetical protein